jgi:hypothetical protein
MLMSSTPSAYPQVVSRCLVSFRVVNSAVIPTQVDFWAWFYSRQLHREGGWSERQALTSFFLHQHLINIPAGG